MGRDTASVPPAQESEETILIALGSANDAKRFCDQVAEALVGAVLRRLRVTVVTRLEAKLVERGETVLALEDRSLTK